MRTASLYLIGSALIAAAAPAVAHWAGSSAESGNPSRFTNPEVAETARARSASAADSTYRFYFGNLHSHTSHSDGTGTPAWAYRYARDTAAISFLAVTDHHSLLTDEEYADILLQAEAYTEDGVFVAIGGQEWSGHDSLTGLANHVNVYEADHVFTAPEEDMTAFYEELAESGCIAIFCHPSPGGFDDFAYSEIGDAGIHAAEVRHEVWEPMYIEILDNGWRVGADGSQDNHEPDWGDGPHWTVALASSLSKARILGAVEAHRTYSTYDRNLKLTFRAEGHWMGESFAHLGDVAFRVAMDDSDPEDAIERAELFQNGHVINWTTPDTSSCSWHPVVTPPNGENYYFVKTYEADGDKAWSGPIWIDCTTALPATPRLRSPADGVIVQTLTPVLSWHPSDGAAAYTLDYSPSDTFPGGQPTVTVPGIADTLFGLTDLLDEATTYFWRVAASNEHGTSTPSGVRSFTTADMPVFSTELELRLTTDPSDDAYPALGLACQELWLLWSSARTGDREIYSMTSSDCGASWSDANRLTFASEEDRHPAVARSEGGRVWVSWEAARGGDWEICAKSYDGESWSGDVNLTQDSGDDVAPSMTHHSDGALWLVWSTNRDGDFEIYYMTFDGQSWSPATRLTWSGGRDSEPGIASVNGDQLWVVWSSGRDGNVEIYLKVFDGVSWSDDTRLTWALEDDTSPSVAQTVDGLVWLAYARDENILYRTCEGDSWSRESKLPVGEAHEWTPEGRPSISQTSDGRIWIAYESLRSGNLDVYAQRSILPLSGVSEGTGDERAQAAFRLGPSYPNPFRSTANIEFALARGAPVELTIYGVTGQRVRCLLRGRVEAGRHVFKWHGKDDRGLDVASGIYFCSLDVGGFHSTRKLVFLR